MFQLEDCKTIGVESSRVSADFQGRTDLVRSESSGIVVKFMLLMDGLHYSSGCSNWTVGDWSSELSGKMGSNFLLVGETIEKVMG